MSEQPAEPDRAAMTYSYRPSLLGAAWEFKLTDGGLDWVVGARSGRVPFRNIRRLRMSYRPMSMQSHRFMTELWADGAPKLQFASSSWKSMVELERLDKSYSAFITELHRRIAAAAAPARFEQGSNPFLYWPGLIIFIGASLALAAPVARALQVGAMGSAALIGGFLVLFVWQGGNFFRRNRPGVYRPDAPPALVMPRR